ncbi:hypothetical protein L6R53_27905 [Myxococcota bacterium]|nr:hypothetical protein [Myxococcota bacterium]
MNRMLPVLALTLGLLGAGPAMAQQATPRVLPSMEERTAAFGAIDEATKAGQTAQAADLLVALTQDPAHQAFHAEAYARLGAMLEKQGYPYAALSAYAQALSTDAQLVASVAKDALRLADQVGDTALLEPVFAKNVGLDVDAATRGRVAYLAARRAHAEGSHGTAVAFLKMVPSDSPSYADAKALEGVVLAHTSRFDDAVKSLEQALAAGATKQDAARWTTLMHLDMARAYYGAGEYVRAIEYFAKVPRSSPWWAQAQFERAWAHFRLDDLNGTLGLLSTHSSPFFSGEYFPEAALLEIYSLFLLCKFPAAGEQIDAFTVRFSPMLKDLQAVGGYSPAEAFERGRDAVLDGKEDRLPVMVARPFLGEARFAAAAATLDTLEAERKKLDGASGAWGEQARQWLDGRKRTLVEVEGGRVLGRAKAMEDELSAMLGNAEMNKLDIMQMESRMYERASFTGVMETAKKTVDRQVRVKQGYRLWPYEGEYWADEIGWFRVDTKPECPESLRSGS